MTKISTVVNWIGNAGGLTTAAVFRTNELALLDKEENHEYEIKVLSFQLDFFEQVEKARRKINNLRSGMKINFKNPLHQARSTTNFQHYTYFVQEHLSYYKKFGRIIMELSEDKAIRYFLETKDKRYHLVTIKNQQKQAEVWLVDPLLAKNVMKLELDGRGTVIIQTNRNPRTDLPTGRRFLREDGTLIFSSMYDDDGKNERFFYKGEMFKTHFDVLIQLDNDLNYQEYENQVIFIDSALVPIDAFKKNSQPYKRLFKIIHMSDYIYWKEDIYGIPDKKYLRKDYKKIYEFVEKESNAGIIAFTELNKQFITSIYPQLTDKVHVIGNLIPRVNIENVLEYPRTPNNFAFIARLDNVQKRFVLALESFAEVVKTNRDAKLHFLGTAHDKKNEELFNSYVKKLNLKDNIVLHGYSDNINQKLLELKIEVAILPARWESFAMVVPEALQLGIKFLGVDTPYWYGLWTDVKGFEVAKISQSPEDKVNIIAESWLKLSELQLSRKEIIDSFNEEWTKLDSAQKYLDIIYK